MTRGASSSQAQEPHPRISASPFTHDRLRLNIMEKKTTSRVSLAALGLILALMAANLLLIRQNFALRR